MPSMRLPGEKHGGHVLATTARALTRMQDFDPKSMMLFPRYYGMDERKLDVCPVRSCSH